ncbi:unnamed protein product [Effrenium voratum]|nr:unnamed protein product [Effrenium voratum]
MPRALVSCRWTAHGAYPQDDALQGERRAKVHKALSDVFFASHGLADDRRLTPRDWQELLKVPFYAKKIMDVVPLVPKKDLLDMFSWLEADEADGKIEFQEVLRGVQTLAEPPSGKSLLQVDSEVKQRFSRLQHQVDNIDSNIMDLGDKVAESYDTLNNLMDELYELAGASVVNQPSLTPDSCLEAVTVAIEAPALEVFRIEEPKKDEEEEDDEDSEDDFDKSSEALWPLAKLQAQLEALSLERPRLQDRKLAVLLTTGAMNPPHRGHAQLLRQASERLTKAGFAVAGAWLSPSHDGYVQPKARKLGTIGLSASFRLEAAERTVGDDALLAVGRWEAMKPGRWPDYPEVAVALQRKLRGVEKAWQLQDGFKVFYACGTDHAQSRGLYRGFLTERGFGVVIVPRAGDDASLEAPERSVFVADSIDGEGASFNSTMVRSALEKHRKSVVNRTLSGGAADFMLRPSSQDYCLFQEDFKKLGIEPPHESETV